MGSISFTDRCNDAISPCKQLANKLQPYASTRAEDEPCLVVYIGVQIIRDLVHRPVADDRLQEDEAEPTEVPRICFRNG